jgi:uncharacterized protein YrrD
MHIEFGTPVRSSDGQDVGHIEKLIIDTQRTEASGLILRHGGLLHKDVHLPLSEVRAAQTGAVGVAYAADIIHEMPAYTPPDPGGPSMAGSERADVATMLAQYALEHTVLQPGSPIKSHDGHKVGTVHQLACETPSGRLTWLVLRRGLLLTEEIELPPTLIAGVGQGELLLSIPADEVDGWANLREGLEVYTPDPVCLGMIIQRTSAYLEVRRPEQPRPIYVPLARVSRVTEERAIVTVEAGQAALWRTPPDADQAVDGVGRSV